MSSTSTYAPLAGSVAYRVVEFLTTHSDESLSATDVAIKFDASAKSVHSLLGQAVQSRALKRVEDLASGEMVYRLDVGVPTIAASPASHPLLPAKSAASPALLPAAPKKRPRAPAFSFDPENYPVENNVPLPTPSPAADWKKLFDRIVVPTVDSARFPISALASVKKAAAKYRNDKHGEMTVRPDGDEHIRVWRAK